MDKTHRRTMYRYCPIVLIIICLILCGTARYSHATAIVTPCSGICLNNSPGAYLPIGNITIREGNSSDFASQSGATIILTSPAGFEFEAGIGTVAYLAGRNISSATISISTTTITVTYTCLGTNRADRLVLGGIKSRGLVSGSAGTIYRTGGTANITGNAAGAGIIHGKLSSDGTGVIVSSIANGNWSSTATWSTGIVPKCNQEVIISHTVTTDIASNNNNIRITTGGNLIANFAISIADTFAITGTGTYTHNNSTDELSTIFAGVEVFSATSNLIINQWSDLTVPLGSAVQGNLGNITFNVGGTWDQNGDFSPARVKGNIILNSGNIVMDDGTGLTTDLTLKDVTINGTSELTVCSGINRNFSFTTNNFYDLSTGAGLTSIMNSCTGVLQWTANGDVTLNDDFSLMRNSGSPLSATMNVTGNFNITGGDIDLMKITSAPLSITIGGNTTISGSPSNVKFIDSGSGAFNYTTGNLTISTGTSISLVSGTFSGTNQFTINGTFQLTGASSTFRFLDKNTYTPNLNIAVGIDILVTDADLYFGNTLGKTFVTCGRNMTVTGSGSVINIQERALNADTTELIVSGTMSVTNSLYQHTMGEGFVILTVGETCILDNATFYGVVRNTSPSIASGTFSFQDFTFLGGTARFVDVKTSAPTVVTINCSNNFSVTWESNSDFIELIPYKGTNEALLNMNVGGNFTVSGNFPAANFISSHATYDENISIGGSFQVSGGLVYLVSDQSAGGTNGHNIALNIGTNIEISGGTTYLSTKIGTAAVVVSGDVIISGGTLNLKWTTGAATMNVAGAYNQTAGIFNIHGSTATTTDTCKVILAGNFIQSGGTFNFDNAAGAAMAEHTLTLNGGAYTVSGSAVITHANNLSANYVFGQIYFNRAGTIIYSRNSTTHQVQHVKQTIRSGTTVNATSSANGFQMTSVASSTAATHTVLNIYGTLDMGDKIVSARQNASYYARLLVESGGRYRTSHTGGLYSGILATASSINGYMLTLNRVNYYLDANSTVEYYGTATSVVTGIPNGIASTASQRYGKLEVNFTGTAGSTWVYPETTDEVFVRTTLILTEGEFNLDNDHTTNGGGRVINIANGATITRTSGFIRSETEDGSGKAKWTIATNGSYVFPFGYDAATYIPFKYQQTSGNSGIVQLATYRTIVSNTPYPPTVTHLRDVYGNDNSLQTVDRFWDIIVPGTTSANMTFTYATSEGTGIISPRAQLWEPVTMGWYLPSGVQSNPTATSTLATGQLNRKW